MVPVPYPENHPHPHLPLPCPDRLRSSRWVVGGSRSAARVASCPRRAHARDEHRDQDAAARSARATPHQPGGFEGLGLEGWVDSWCGVGLSWRRFRVRRVHACCTDGIGAWIKCRRVRRVLRSCGTGGLEARFLRPSFPGTVTSLLMAPRLACLLWAATAGQLEWKWACVTRVGVSRGYLQDASSLDAWRFGASWSGVCAAPSRAAPPASRIGPGAAVCVVFYARAAPGGAWGVSRRGRRVLCSCCTGGLEARFLRPSFPGTVVSLLLAPRLACLHGPPWRGSSSGGGPA